MRPIVPLYLMLLALLVVSCVSPPDAWQPDVKPGDANSNGDSSSLDGRGGVDFNGFDVEADDAPTLDVAVDTTTLPKGQVITTTFGPGTGGLFDGQPVRSVITFYKTRVSREALP